MDKGFETYLHNFILLNWHFSQIIDNKKRLGAAMEIIVPDANKADLFSGTTWVEFRGKMKMLHLFEYQWEKLI